MSYLLTSDWQAQWSNLPSCEKAADSLLNLVNRYHPEAVVFAGDLKDQYNPVDLRVTQFWMDFIKTIRLKNATPILVLGNHDRIGLYQDERNWFPILEAAGARVFWEADAFRLKEETLYILPFLGNQDRWAGAMEWLLNQNPNTRKDDLIFHLTLKGAMFNKLGTLVDGDQGVPLSALHADRFRYCLGGDIHLPQRVLENVFYGASPFPIDWGEVNQTKVFGRVSKEKGLEWIPTGLPGWYDPSVRGFKEPKSWEGCRIRIHVPVLRGDDYGQEMAEAKIIAEKKYMGAQITPVPDFKEEDRNQGEAVAQLSEQEQIRTYISQVLPDEMKDELDQMVAFIEYKIRATHQGLRMDTGIRFIRAWGEKFLSFDRVKIEFNQKGIILITAVNHDRPGRSNGGGKTNYAQVLPVALFGKTFKGQTFDDWVQRGSKGMSRAGCEFMVHDGSLIKVERTRNPTGVHLWVNGKEI